jgi:hypothetical protein
VDHVAAARIAEYPGVHNASAYRPGTVAGLNTIGAWTGQHSNGKTHQCRTFDADATGDQ